MKDVEKLAEIGERTLRDGVREGINGRWSPSLPHYLKEFYKYRNEDDVPHGEPRMSFDYYMDEFLRNVSEYREKRLYMVNLGLDVTLEDDLVAEQTKDFRYVPIEKGDRDIFG